MAEFDTKRMKTTQSLFVGNGLSKQELSEHGRNIVGQAISFGSLQTPRDGEALILQVTIMRADNLDATDLFSKIDPYVIVEYAGNNSISPVHKDAGKHVEFNWTVSFPFNPLHVSPLNITIMDFDSYKRDDLVGAVSLDPSYFSMTSCVNPLKQSFLISRKKGWTQRSSSSGSVRIKAWVEPFKVPAQLEQITTSSVRRVSPFPTPSLRVIYNWNSRGGAIRYLLDGGRIAAFPTWQINLWAVNDVFGEPISWNHAYPAAQKIFGQGFKSKLLRSVIHTQYRILYSCEQARGVYRECHVNGLQALFNVLKQGVNDQGKVVRFTYVIRTDCFLHFSVTSKRLGQDLLSKHALHANAAEHVFCAGEFFFDLKSARYQKDKVPALIIDNNSGTYAPPKERLLDLVRLFELNFGFDMPIFAFDREDPRLKLYFDQNHVE